MGMPADRTRLLAGAAGLASFVAAGLLQAGPTQAQSQQPGELLRQVLPGLLGQEDPQALRDAGEQACERYAEDQGLDVRRVLDARRAGEEDLEVTLEVEDRDDRYDAVCLYDGRDREVRELERARGSTSSARRGGDEEVDEALAQRARDACRDAAEDRDLDEVDADGEVRERDRGTLEVVVRGRDRGERRELTCRYDTDDRRAFLAAE